MSETLDKTLYGICGVEKTATADQIKKAYRGKANELHPDKTVGDDSEFKELALAYSVISDPERRKEYDETGQSETVTGKAGKARDMLIKFFCEAVDGNDTKHSDIFLIVGSKIDNSEFQTKEGATKLEAIIEKQQETISRIEAGNPIFATVLESRIIKHEEMLRSQKAVLVYYPLMRDLLKGSKYRFEQEQEEATIYVNTTNGIW